MSQIPAVSWDTISSGALTVLSSMTPIIAFAIGLVVLERVLPLARPLLLRAGAFFGLKPKSAGSGKFEMPKTEKGGR